MIYAVVNTKGGVVFPISNTLLVFKGGDMAFFVAFNFKDINPSSAYNDGIIFSTFDVTFKLHREDDVVEKSHFWEYQFK